MSQVTAKYRLLPKLLVGLGIENLTAEGRNEMLL